MKILDYNGLKQLIIKIKELLDKKADKTELSRYSPKKGGGFRTSIYKPDSNCNSYHDEWVLGNGTNYPGNGYWYIHTIHYVRADTRMQLAYSYINFQQMYFRNCYQDNWSSWKKIASIDDIPTSVSGKDISRAKTDGYASASTWQSVSNERDLEDWIGDFDKRTRELKKGNVKSVNGIAPDSDGNIKLVIDPYPTDPVVGFAVRKSGNNLYLSWNNPNDPDFEGVKIIKNYEHYPTSIDDGTEVLDTNGSKNTQSYTDYNVRRGTYTYYRIFPFDFHRNYNMDSGQTGRELIKADQSAPNAPTLREVTYDKVVLNDESGIEYSKDGSSWQSSNTFYNLNDNTNYTFYARKAGTTYLNPSSRSSGLNVRTKEAPYDDKIGSPGNRKLLKGNMQQGWFGEVSASSFITGDELARKVGISAGTSQYSNEGWLKFAYMGNVEFVAKKPIRYSISWDSINAANAVFGNRTIDIGGHTYKIRLMKGKTEGKQGDSSSYQGTINRGSEWNKLMLPIHKNAPSNWAYKDNVNSPTQDWGVDYSDADLLTHYNNGNGSYSWCQEYGENTGTRLRRGASGVSGSSSFAPYYGGSRGGWRPVLELVR